jgi:hypothetical protein
MDERADPERLGKQLRKDIDRAYKSFVETGKLKNQGTGRNYITDVVTRYIPVGSSFERAEEILRAGGFEIQPRIPNRYLPEVEKYDERALIEHYQPTVLGKTSVVILLRPPSPNDYSVIKNLVAEIVRTFP